MIYVFWILGLGAMVWLFQIARELQKLNGWAELIARRLERP